MKRVFAWLTVTLALSATAAAQTTLVVSARDLYASARYDEALAMLNAASPADSPSIGDRKAIEQYRSLCLLALGRGTEAEKAIAAVVTADPSYQPSEAEASPRVRTAFTEVRQRLLPDIARSRYADAKGSFDRKDFQQAEGQFRSLLALIDDPDMGGRLGDLRVLVTGFLDLSSAAAAPPPPPAAPAPAPSRQDDPAPAAPAIPQAAAAQAPEARIYGGDDANVVLPTVVKQELPRVAPQIASQARAKGLLEVVIDEQGRVINATLRVGLHPLYDAQLLAAAQAWKYKAATLNGQPVKFRKVIQVSLTR